MTRLASLVYTALAVGVLLACASPSAPATEAVAGPCDKPKAGWIFCDDFERDRSASYFEYDSAGGSFTRVAGVGVDGSKGMRARFAAGQSNAGSLKIAFGKTPDIYIRPVDAGTVAYREIYWRWLVRYDSAWTGGGGDKMSRAQSLATASWAQAMVAPVWSGHTSDREYLFIDPVSGVDASSVLRTTSYGDEPHLHYLGAARADTPLFDAAHLGHWYCVEAHVRLNDAGSANGLFELWIDGRAEAARGNLDWIGGYGGYGVNTVFLENYWNDGSPRAQERYFDNFVVSTERIGC